MEWNILYHSIYIRSGEGRILGEVMFPEKQPGVFDIERTYTAEELIGSDLPAQLVDAAVKRIREQGGRITASCPFALKYLHQKGVLR